MAKYFRFLIGSFIFFGLSHLSFGDSLSVRWLGSWPYRGAGAVATGEVEGNPYLFLGSGGGVIILDVSNPSSPIKVGEVGTPLSVCDLFFSNNRLYVANSYRGLRIYDVSDPSSPLFLGNCPIPHKNLSDFNSAYDVWVKDNYAYIAGNTYGLQIVDVSNPSSPKEIGHYDTPGQALSISVQGDYAYIADRHGGLRIIDISDPSNPEEVGVGYGGIYINVFVSGDYAYIIDDLCDLEIIDVSDPKNPALKGYFPGGGWNLLGAIWVVDSLAYFISPQKGLHIIDVSNPEKPQELGLYPVSDMPFDVEVSGNYAYVPNNLALIKGGIDSLEVIDISQPSNPRLRGVYIPPSGHFNPEVEVWEDYAYIEERDSLLVIDISDPTRPRKVGAIQASSNVYGAMAISYPYLYFSQAKKDTVYLRIIDISDLLNPKEAGVYPLPFSRFSDLGISGSHLYGLNRERYLCIYDISDPLNPKEMGRFKGHNIGEFSISGDYICAAGGGTELWIIDVSNPEEPKEVGTYYPSEGTLLPSVDVVDNYMYAFGAKGTPIKTYILEVIDISDPADPEKVGSIEIPAVPETGSSATQLMGAVSGWRLRVSGSYAYINMVSTLWVVDVSNPENPKIAGFYETALIEDINVIERYIYGMDSGEGLKIFEFYGGQGVEETYQTPGEVLRLLSSNPSKAVVSIRCQLTSKGPISLKVYDIQGRLVRTLIRAKNQELGAYTIKWNGRDDKGEILPPGVYFIKLEAKGINRTKKVILMR